jgi:hypothetical protein
MSFGKPRAPQQREASPLARVPEALFDEYVALVKATTARGDVSWTKFYRSLSLVRSGLTPAHISSLKAFSRDRARPNWRRLRKQIKRLSQGQIRYKWRYKASRPLVSSHPCY